MFSVVCFINLVGVTEPLFFLGLCSVVFLIQIINKWGQLSLLRKAKSEALRRLAVEGPDITSDIPDVIERGVYNLYNEGSSTPQRKRPSSETLVDAAGCGMSSFCNR